MASNLIHFMDFLNWVSKSKKIKVYQNKISKKLYKSKRKGFHEIRGEIVFKDEKENILKVSDKKNNKKKFLIKNLNNLYKISDNILHIKKKNSLTIKKKFSSNLQSSLTIKIYNKLLKKNKCDLPKLEETINLHGVFYTILNSLFNKNKKTYFFT